MFQKSELEQLRLRKEQLVAQSEANRQALATDWQRVCSPGSWLDEAGGFLRRHPASTTAAAVAAGVLMVKILRRPGGITGMIGQVGKMASLALTLWRLFRRKAEK